MPNDKNSRAIRRLRVAGFQRLVEQLERSRPALNLLISASVPKTRAMFEALVRKLIAEQTELAVFGDRTNQQMFDDLIEHAVRTRVRGEVGDAVTQYQANKNAARWVHRCAAIVASLVCSSDSNIGLLSTSWG